MADYQRVAAEFGLGSPLTASPLAGGGPDVTKLVTARGEFVIKPAGRASHTDLYEQAAEAVNAAGLRQARPLRTITGALVSTSGHGAQEFLPGQICLHPTPAQTAAVMRHCGAYHAALARVPVPAQLAAEVSLWTQVVSPGFLLDGLPGLVRRSALPPGRDRVARRALSLLEAAVPRLDALAPQLVHGDIGPDNVLMDGERVVAVVDFTPFAEPVMFAIATALYWYHVYGRPTLDTGAIRASLAAAAPGRPWSDVEIAVWPPMLLREALRRLATYLTVAERDGVPAPARTRLRYEAVCSILDSWSAL